MTMGHYTREDLPFYYALANAYTVCDQHYCAVMTSTSPNRLLSVDRHHSRPAKPRLAGFHAERGD